MRSRTLSHICPLTFSTTQKRKHRHWDVAKLEIIMSKALKILTAAVDILLLIDIASDLVRKYRERKAGKNNIVSPDTEEEPIPEEA